MRHLSRLLAYAVLVCVPTLAAAADVPPMALSAVPVGRLRTEIAALDPAAQATALQALATHPGLLADAASVHASRSGQMYYVCAGVAPPQAAAQFQPAAQGAPILRGSVPITAPPPFHSRPGAPRTIYLDFNGMTVTGTQWNVDYPHDVFEAKPFDLDGSGKLQHRRADGDP